MSGLICGATELRQAVKDAGLYGRFTDKDDERQIRRRWAIYEASKSGLSDTQIAWRYGIPAWLVKSIAEQQARRNSHPSRINAVVDA